MQNLKNKYSLLVLVFLLLPFFYGCGSENSQAQISENVNDSIPVYDFDSFEELLYTENDKIHIVNFWAMWCGPCVKEMPILQAYQKENPNVELLLVSLDFPEDIETKLKPFLKEKGINSKVVLLDDPDSNSWIDRVNSNWSGSIPYTIIFNNKERSYHERAFHDIKDLENEIKKTFKNQQ